MKDKMLKAKLLSKYENKPLNTINPAASSFDATTNPALGTGLPTANSAASMNLPTIDVPGAMPVPHTQSLAALELLAAIKAKDAGKVKPPLVGEIEMGPTEVMQSYSPIQNYLKKGKKQ